MKAFDAEGCEGTHTFADFEMAKAAAHAQVDMRYRVLPGMA